MAKTLGNSSNKTFHRAFRGYRKKEVEAYLAQIAQERAIAEADCDGRIALLVQETEHASQMLRNLQEEKESLLAANEEYKKQLKESTATVQMLYDRLDLLGSETEQLQLAFKNLKRSTANNDLSAEEWKQRALTAEETVRRFAAAEVNANAERDRAHHIRLPFGKKAYLNMTFRKDYKDI